MINSLKFVMGAVSKKDFIPALTHFRIENGTVRSYNGTLALSTPIPLNIDCTPKAEPLIKAIQNCDDTVSLSLTPTGKLSVRSGAFKALIECVTEETPHVSPEGEEFEIDGEALLKAIKTVAPFIGDDASRPWSNGVLLLGQSAFATNNVMLVEYWVGSSFPICCCLPRAAVKEMIRINQPPLRAQVTDNNITFHYENDRWLRSQLLQTNWPDLNKILSARTNQTPIDSRVFQALSKLKPFTDDLGRIYFNKGVVSTTEPIITKMVGGEESAICEGASFEIPELTIDGIYCIEMLQLMEKVAMTADFTTYPNPSIFMGDRLRGAIIGIRR